MGFIIGLVAILVFIGLVIASFHLMVKAAKYLIAAVLGLYLAPGLIAGYASHRATRALRISCIAQPATASLAAAFSLLCLTLQEGLWAGAYILSALLAVAATISRARANRLVGATDWGDASKIVLRDMDLSGHVALWLLVTAFLAGVTTQHYDLGIYAWIGWGYWAAAGLALAFSLRQLADFLRVVRKLEQEVPGHEARPVAALVSDCKKFAASLAADIDRLIPMHVASHVLGGRLVEIEVGRRTLLYASSWYAGRLDILTAVLSQNRRFSDEEFETLAKQYLKLSREEALEHLSLQLHLGRRYQLEDGHFFVAYAADYEIETCASCGMGRIAAAPNKAPVEWFCSDICKSTEQTCLDIHRQAPESFVADSVGLGMTLVSASDSWIRNHKVVAAGSQGHGVGAEHANTYIDRLFGKFSRSVGADNVKNGADRVVDGTKIQTKYCKTAGKSIGQAFDKDGNYRYWDGDTPMQLEVPRDQYDKAVAAMRRKIQAGGMHSITNPDQATEIVRRGHLTYEHAKNLTKFGRWESISYDAAEGIVTGAGSATIGFSVTAGLVYFRTGDAKVALQAAAIQAGKAGLTAAVSHISTQQLHRIELVQGALKHVDMNCLPSSVRTVLEAGYGVTSANQLNHAMRGNIVAAIVSVAVTSVPDVYRLIRREVTLAKLKRTALTATGAVVGATAGSVAGGAVGVVYGPLGAWAGKFIGGTLGTMAGGALVDALFADQKEREREAANSLFRAHLEHLALGFSLNEGELRCVIKNFLRVSSDDMHQKILAGKRGGRPYLNSVLKPIVVGVVKQRDFCLLEGYSEARPVEAA